ncbi:MAG: transposase [Deltaproteobacteria bacterium]|jgi:transposase|nr:transposase [Deltaproteobacteria bacterium]
MASDYLAYDVTSFSTFTKGLEDFEWGYNRDKEKLPQINFGCYHAFRTGLPLFYVTYPGSIVDKSHMPYIMSYNNELDINNVIFILANAFHSTKNIFWLYDNKIKYILPIYLAHRSIKNIIDQVRDGITSIRYRCTDGVFAKTISDRFYGVKTNIYLYYSTELLESSRLDLF